MPPPAALDNFAVPLPVNSISTDLSAKKQVGSEIPASIKPELTAPKKARVSKFSDTPPIAPNGPRTSKFSDKPLVTASQASVDNNGSSGKLNAAQIAAAAAARINASLRAKGKLADETLLKPSTPPSSSSNSALSLIQISQPVKINEIFVAKVDINDLPAPTRAHLVQVQVQDQVNKLTAAAISTRGHYLPPTDKKKCEGIDKQLHLYIQSPLKLNVDLAITKLKDIILKFKLPSALQNRQPASNVSSSNSRPLPGGHSPIVGQPTLPTGNYVHEKVFVGMDYTPPEFDLRTKLIGVNYTNFNFVANTTGAKVILRGRGSGFLEPTSGREAFESMYVFISHPNHNGVQAAKKLVLNLIETVRSQLSSHKSSYSSQTNPYPSMGQYSAYGGGGQMNQHMPYSNGPVPNQYPYPQGAPHNPYVTAYHNAMPSYSNTYISPQSDKKDSNGSNNYPSPVPPPPTHATEGQNSPKAPPTRDADEKKTKDVDPPKPKRRRFVEKTPDDSDVLGYKQVGDQSGVSERKTNHIKTPRINNHKEEKSKVPSTKNNSPSNNHKPTSNTSSNLPFWMQHTFD